MDRNFFLAIGLSMALLFGFQFFIEGPRQKAYQAELEEYRKNNPEAVTETGEIGDLAAPALIEVDDAVDIDDAIKKAPGRIKIDTPELLGSLNLQGARIDDLSLKNHRAELSEDSGMLRVFKPRESSFGHYVQTGFITGRSSDENAVWTVAEGTTLTPKSPITLTRSEAGLDYTMKISVDEKFMFTAEKSVTNTSGAEVLITPYATAVQRGMRTDLKNFFILLEGPLAVVGGKLYDRKYKDLIKKGDISSEEGTGGWVGLTDKLELGAVIPPQNIPFKASLKNRGTKEAPFFYASYALNGKALTQGETYTSTEYMFGGYKVVADLKSYQAPIDQGGLGIVNFDKAVDWGVLSFFTRPIHYFLHLFAELTGNYGIAILLLTLVIKAILFPLANKAYKSTAGMKKVQPELVALRERYPDDKMKLQQEMMALYKKHNINPMAGCLPILIQMPIFFALYKVIFVTGEIRHKSFLYIQDLSEADPTTVFNLFGLLPYDPTAIPVIGGFLAIGLLPFLMGIFMWVQMKLNPPATDPVQQQVMMLMPILFTFIFAPFAAGLVVYWVWNTVLSIAQQWTIMKRQGVEVDLFGNIMASFKRKKADAANNDN